MSSIKIIISLNQRQTSLSEGAALAGKKHVTPQVKKAKQLQLASKKKELATQKAALQKLHEAAAATSDPAKKKVIEGEIVKKSFAMRALKYVIKDLAWALALMVIVAIPAIRSMSSDEETSEK